MSDTESKNNIERYKNYFATQCLDAILLREKFLCFMPPSKPLTRREKLQLCLLDYCNRIALAWAALRGERMVSEDDLP